MVVWIRCPKTAATAWWFDEYLAGQSLFDVGAENDLQLRAFSKSRQKTCRAFPLSKLHTPAEQWNFIGVRSELRNGDTYLTFQVNDQKFSFKNADLFPIQVDDGKSRTVFAVTSKIQLDELMIFHAALSDADIQSLRANANP